MAPETADQQQPSIVREDWGLLARTQIGVTLTAGQRHTFDQLRDTLIDWSSRINLTAIAEPSAVEIRHFLDSLTVLTILPADLPEAQRVIDVGTGAGFPGLPLKIIRPQWQMTLLEATGKKVDFLTHVVGELGLSGVTIVNARAEDAGQQPAHREQYDLVLARAVAQMPALMEYLLPLCAVGGRCIALKGSTAADELKSAAKAIRILGGQPDPEHPLTQIDLPGVAEPHFLVMIQKIAHSPAKYPRRPGVPAKTPLR